MRAWLKDWLDVAKMVLVVALIFGAIAWAFADAVLRTRALWQLGN